MQKIYASLLLCFIFFSAIAQYPGAGSGSNRAGAGRVNLNIGHFYGKIVDYKKKGIVGVTVQLFASKYDTTTHQIKQKVVKTDITENNGDFDLDAISLMGNYKLKISAVGYKKIEMPVSFGIKRPEPGTTPDFQKIMAMADKDLGNIKLETDAAVLEGVTVTSTAKPVLEIGLDRKVFNVDKNLGSTGQTATEVMKGIPSVSVDIDGNVTLRNATPTIFVDGRPTTLTLDEIPADIIDKVEIITNPSAKFDASGGGAGILNIILKKNRKNGYNGNIRTGIDGRGKINAGGDLNYRQNKINFTGSANYNQRKYITSTQSNTTYFGNPNTEVDYHTAGTNNGNFQFYRAGIDYFADIRNTFSIAGNYTKGDFDNGALQSTDSSHPMQYISFADRNSQSSLQFQNVGAQISYKHNFAKDGEDITADINYNSVNNSNNTFINSLIYDTIGGNRKYPLPYQQQSNGSGYNHYFTVQSDYENPITDSKRIEAGVRAAIRDFETTSLQYSGDSAQALPYSYNASSMYKYRDEVFAAYATYSFKINKLSLQVGLRGESSNYSGRLYNPLTGADSAQPIKVSYPISLFPSIYMTYKLDDNQSFQLNYSRKINRPNFFQILPVYNFSDPQNPSVGNPSLKPEFANNLEWSYNNNYNRTDNFLATAFLKYSTDLISNYIYKDVNKDIQSTNTSTDSLFYSSYINANYSYSYGLELTDKMNVAKWWDLLMNINFLDSKLSTNIPNQTAINNSLLSWFSKVNSTFKVGKGISLQITWESRSKTITPQNGGGMGGGGGRSSGGYMGGGPQTLAQGYTLPRYWDIDAAIRKDWTWKNGKGASLTVSMNDIFKTGNKTQATATYFSQYTERYRDPQLLRVNFSYRFGKVDASLFKRKNTKADQSGALEGLSGGN